MIPHYCMDCNATMDGGRTEGPEPLYTPERVKLHESKGHEVKSEYPGDVFWHRVSR